MKKTLWSHDFTIITIGTLVSAIGSTAMNFALSLVIYDHTSSTLMTGVFAAVSLIPTILLPILAAPLVDHAVRKNIIYKMDAFNGFLYLGFALYLTLQPFSYGMYLIFSLIISSTGAVYNLAYLSLYPDLIPKGYAQKGYSISSMIYPGVTAIFTPVASVLYVRYGFSSICLLEGLLLLVAAAFERTIRYEEGLREGKQQFQFQVYKEQLMEGIHYLGKEKGIRSIYAYMALTNASGEGVNLMSMALFQSSPLLNTMMYAFLTTAETAGRILGAVVHYFVKIPYKKRFTIAVSVYGIYEVFDIALLFLAYPLMIVNRFICGFLGVNSMNIREASTQNYIPSHMRARVNAFFSVAVALILMLSKLVAGILGELMPYPYVAVLFAGIAMIGIYVLILRNKEVVKKVYNQDI